MAKAETEPHSTERERLRQEYLGRVTDKYRSKTDLIILFSKFSFLMGSRFYTPPVHKTPECVKKYTTLRANLINAWYGIVGPEVLKNVNPELSLVAFEPKSIAVKVFPPTAQYDVNKLRDRKRKFDMWFKRERESALLRAEKTGDVAYKSTTELQWRVAREFGNQLHDALLPRARAITNTERGTDFNYNCGVEKYFHDSEDDDEMMERPKERPLPLFTHIDEGVVELDHDEYVVRQLVTQDAQLLLPSVFGDMVDDCGGGGLWSDGVDYVMDDGGAYIAEYENHMNTNADGADIKRDSYKNVLRVTNIPISRGQTAMKG